MSRLKICELVQIEKGAQKESRPSVAPTRNGDANVRRPSDADLTVATVRIGY